MNILSADQLLERLLKEWGITNPNSIRHLRENRQLLVRLEELKGTTRKNIEDYQEEAEILCKLNGMENHLTNGELKPEETATSTGNIHQGDSVFPPENESNELESNESSMGAGEDPVIIRKEEMNDKPILTLKFFDDGMFEIGTYHGTVRLNGADHEMLFCAAAHLDGEDEAWSVDTDVRPYSRWEGSSCCQEDAVNEGDWKFDMDGDCAGWWEGFSQIMIAVNRLCQGDVTKLHDCFLHGFSFEDHCISVKPSSILIGAMDKQ